MQDQLVLPPSYESIMEPTHSALPRFLYMLARELASAIQWWVVWLAFAFVVASVALRMLRERRSPDEMITMGEAFQLVLRHRLSALIVVSALGALASVVFNLSCCRRYFELCHGFCFSLIHFAII
jgi:TctA family transporter